MLKFMIGPMCVTEDDFKQQLKENGLKFGYIKRLYEKWKDDDLTYFRVIIEGCPFVIFTDDENSYPEIEEETEKKIEEYSLEWLNELIYNTKLAGPISSEALLSELEMYLRVNKAKQCDETRKQEECPYCHAPYKAIGVSDEIYEDDGEGIFVKDGKLIALSECGYIRFEQEINYCPICRRKLEA